MINHFVQITKDLQFMVSLNILSIVTNCNKPKQFNCNLQLNCFGLWPFWFVAVLVCGRVGCGRVGVWPFWFVAVLTCMLYILS